MNEIFDPNSIEFLLSFVQQIGCRPPNAEAYKALTEAVRLEKGILSGEITQVEGMSPLVYSKIVLGLTADKKDLMAEDRYIEAVDLVDKYVCKKRKVSLADFDAALDWQIDQIDEIRGRGSFN